MTKYKENPLFKEVIAGSYKLGQAARKRFTPRKSKTPDFEEFRSVRDQTRGLAQLGTTTVPYGGSTRYEKFHPGIDVANKIGTQIPATVGGKVTEVQTGQVKGSPGFGNYVIVEDPYGSKHRYSHLYQSFVKPGQYIPRGASLGTMGSTGQTYSLHGGTGSHLDYRIRDIYNRYVNPLIYLAKYQ